MRKKTLRKQVGVYSYAQVMRQDVNQLYILFESKETEAILLIDTENATAMAAYVSGLTLLYDHLQFIKRSVNI